MVNTDYDLIVIGAGVIGLATAYTAALKLGKSVLVWEQDDIGTQNGSSSGTSRQFRLMHSAANQGQLAKRSVKLWAELAQDASKLGLTDKKLIYDTDELWLGNDDPDLSGPEGDFLKTVDICEALKIDIQIIDSSVLRDKYHFTNIDDSANGKFIGLNGLHHTDRPGYVAGAGTVNVPFLIKVLYDLCKSSNVKFITENPVEVISASDEEVGVIGQSKKRYSAKKLVIAAGCWTNNLLKKHFNLELNLKVWQMLSCYFKVEDPSLEHPMFITFSYPEPNSIWTPDHSGKTGIGFYYGFPEAKWEVPGYIRVCPTTVLDEYTDANDATHKPNEKEVKATENWVAKHIKGVSPRAEHISTCLTTINEADGDFICGLVPGHKNVAVFTAGWAMKVVPMFGKLLTDLVFDNQNDAELTEILHSFRVDRPGLIIQNQNESDRHHDVHNLHQRRHMVIKNIMK